MGDFLEGKRRFSEVKYYIPPTIVLPLQKWSENPSLTRIKMILAVNTIYFGTSSDY